VHGFILQAVLLVRRDMDPGLGRGDGVFGVLEFLTG
jgi:hypothetical protein